MWWSSVISAIHGGLGGHPSLAIYRSQDLLHGFIGDVFTHEVPELVLELFGTMSRLEKQTVLDKLLPESFCKNPDHPK